VWAFARKQVAAGQQAYIVYPVIEGAKDDQPELDFAHDETEEEAVAIGRKADYSTPLRSGRNDKSSAQKKTKSPNADKLFAPKKALRAATDMYEELRSGALAGLRLGLLHGRLSPDDKEIVMRRFQRGEIDVLIATTVI